MATSAVKPLVYCLPFAGGSSYSYNGFKKYSNTIEFVPIELPGRGKRFMEELVDDLCDLAEDALNQIDIYNTRPYGLYGHSMGSTIAFLVARKINALKLRSPDHIFVSGRAGPSIQRNITSIANLPKQQFLEKLRVLGGSPPEFLEDEELVHYFEPILRSDFKAVETYQYTPGTLLEIPITCMIGSEEDVTVDEAKAWQNETTKPVCFKQFIGGHFFILEHEQNIVALIEKSLSR